MLNQLLLPELREAIESQDTKSLSSFCEILHPSTVAQMLEELNEPDVHARAFQYLDTDGRARLFEYLPVQTQDELADNLPVGEMASLIERMSHDERVDLVKRLDDERQAKIMPLVARADREDIIRLAKYEESTAGSIMTTDYAALPDDVTVEEAIRRLGREAPDRETIYYIYVLDAERRLIGFVGLKDLIRAPRWRKVSEIMREDVVSVPADMDVEAAAAHLAQYDLIALPVVDSDRRLVGIITHDDVIDVVIDAATDDAHLMGGVQPISASYLTTPFWETLRKRLPALIVLFAAELVASFVLGLYGGLLTVTVLVLFLPVIIATGGNSGSQAATLVTRAIALGEIAPGDWWKIALREVSQGVLLGIMIGSLAILAIVIMRPDAHAERLAVILVLSLIVVTTCGSVVGSLLPMVFLKLGIDPAYSSGPFVSSMVDVVGIFIYMSIAAVVLSGALA